MKIELLNPSHDRCRFDCANELLNHYFKTQAGQDIRRNLSVCFVLSVDGQQVCGFYTLANSSIPLNSLPEKLAKALPPSYQNLPVTLLGRLAVDASFKGQGLGVTLLVDALKRSLEVAETSIGSLAVVVDPIDNQAIDFYIQYGFILLPDSGKMFFPMKTVERLFAG